MEIFFEFNKVKEVWEHRNLIDQMRKGLTDGHGCLPDRIQKDVRQFRVSDFKKSTDLSCGYSFKVELLMKVVIERENPLDSTSYSVSFTDHVEYLQHKSVLSVETFGKNLFISTFNAAIQKRLSDIENETRRLKGLLISK